MMEAGAKSVRAIASHCVMSDPASFRVQESGLTEMVFTDSIPYAKKCAKVKQLSIADMFAETIKRVMNNESISSLRIELEMSANVQPILHSSFFIFKELFPSYKFLF